MIFVVGIVIIISVDNLRGVVIVFTADSSLLLSYRVDIQNTPVYIPPGFFFLQHNNYGIYYVTLYRY